jgi:uncharacterized protein
LEKFYGFDREVALNEANAAFYNISASLELGCPGYIREEHKAAVEGYNRDDCASTLRLRDWLDGEASEQLTEWQQMIRDLVLQRRFTRIGP